MREKNCQIMHAFFISNTFVSNSKLKNIKQNLSNTLRLNFCYLKFISSLHARYHSKKGLIMCHKKCVSVFKFNDKRKWKWKIDHTVQGHVRKYTNNTKNVSVWCCLYILSTTSATSDTQFMKKLSNTEAELKKKTLLIKKACN